MSAIHSGTALGPVQAAIGELMGALHGVGLTDSYIRDALRSALDGAVNEACAAQHAHNIADELETQAARLHDELRAARIDPLSVGRYNRANEDANTVRQHVHAMIDVIWRRQRTTDELVNGHASLEHLVLADLPL